MHTDGNREQATKHYVSWMSRGIARGDQAAQAHSEDQNEAMAQKDANT